MFQLRDILYMHSKQLTVSYVMENLDEKTIDLLGIEVDYSKVLDEPLKMCNKCQRNLSISLFSKKKTSKTGGVIYQPKCKKCVSAYKKNYDVVNKLKRKEDRIKSAAADRITKQIYYEKNKSAIKAYAKKYQTNNREKINANRRAYYKKIRIDALHHIAGDALKNCLKDNVKYPIIWVVIEISYLNGSSFNWDFLTI